jgi:hypothetical protein
VSSKGDYVVRGMRCQDGCEDIVSRGERYMLCFHLVCSFSVLTFVIFQALDVVEQIARCVETGNVLQVSKCKKKRVSRWQFFFFNNADNILGNFS